MIRVLIAEDSLTCRDLLSALIESDPELCVAGTARDGLEAVTRTRDLKPDVVVMDIHMPNLDGFQATRRIMVEHPTPIVIVSASVDVRDAEISMQALRAGALSVLAKPALTGSEDFAELSATFTSTVRAMAGVRVVRRLRERSSSVPPLASERPLVAAGRIVAFGASTGGPAALHQVLCALPGDLPAPILVVQHIAPGFVAALVSWLDAAAQLTVEVAKDGMSMRPGHVYFAPDGHHLRAHDRHTIGVVASAPVGGFRPSASVLFESVAHTFGKETIAVILTGMGEDGLSGLREVHDKGGQIIAQDEQSSVVFGMPGAAVAAGIADSISPLDLVAVRVQRMLYAEGHLRARET